jgi:cyclopropane fatty-acyl-phospholipid synthase-like methyltransferase
VTTLDIQKKCKPDICCNFIEYLEKTEEKDKYDIIVIDIFTFSKMHGIDDYMDKIYNLLKPNGRFIFEHSYIICGVNEQKEIYRLTYINLPIDYFFKIDRDVLIIDHIRYIRKLANQHGFNFEYHPNEDYPVFQNKYKTNYFELIKI